MVMVFLELFGRAVELEFWGWLRVEGFGGLEGGYWELFKSGKEEKFGFRVGGDWGLRVEDFMLFRVIGYMEGGEWL